MEDEIKMSFPGGKQVMATVGGHSVLTDQPVDSGGAGEAMTPVSLFLASIGACAGFYVLSFCQKREIPMDGIEVTAQPRKDEGGVVVGVGIRVQVPPTFPERYHGALLRSVKQCSVKRSIEAQPTFDLELVARGAEGEGTQPSP